METAEQHSRVQVILDALAREIDRQRTDKVEELDLVHLATVVDGALDNITIGAPDDGGVEPGDLNAANDS
ncbi:hypothetical protein [Devosia sp.]|uniref:hypothetical protein n=1 Tax=Devosia sp. TaxID=1871048 RepID=UPI003BA91528